ncbi:Dephospho-CoA kinase [Balamuthia mandrillaris]
MKGASGVSARLRSNFLGVTGGKASGKDTFADYLVHHYGFVHISLSDLVREELRRRDMLENIDNLINLGNELRQKEGTDALAQRALAKIDQEEIRGMTKRYVISSLRHPSEVQRLRASNESFTLVYLEAPLQLRYERCKARGRLGDVKSFEEFVAKEKQQEFSTVNVASQQMNAVYAMADVVLTNDATSMEEFQQKIDQLLLRSSASQQRTTS